MKMELYCVKDTLAGEYGMLFAHKNVALAKRWFGDLMEKNPNVAKDCELYKIGDYNFESGVISSDIQFICSGVSSIKAGD